MPSYSTFSEYLGTLFFRDPGSSLIARLRMITERDVQVLLALSRYYVLNRPQIQRLCFPDDKTGRVTRRRLQTLFSQKLVNRQRVIVDYPHLPPPGSIYYPAKRGRELIAEYLDDERQLLTPVQPPQPQHVLHWLAVSDTHLTIDAAISRQQPVKIEGWINEWDVVNKDETDPDKRFQLYTLLRHSPRLVCAPDFAFLLTLGSHSKVFYGEQDRGTCGVQQVAARKSPGYAAMASKGLHRRHFPSATVDAFTVLLIAPTVRRRDALRKAISEKPGKELWKFIAAPDLTPDTFLHAPILYPCIGDPSPLVKPGSTESVPST